MTRWSFTIPVSAACKGEERVGASGVRRVDPSQFLWRSHWSLGCPTDCSTDNRHQAVAAGLHCCNLLGNDIPAAVQTAWLCKELLRWLLRQSSSRCGQC